MPRLVALVVLTVWAVFPLNAQPLSDREKIAAIMKIRDATAAKLHREVIIPHLVTRRSYELLSALGKRLDFGASWHPGNAYWKRATDVIRNEFSRLEDEVRPEQQQEHKKLLERLGPMSGVEIDEVFNLFTSELYEKAMKIVEASYRMILLVSDARWGSVKELQDIQALMKQMEVEAGFPLDVETRIVKAFNTPTMQKLAISMAGMANDIGSIALVNPSGLSMELSDSAMKEIVAIGTEYLKSETKR